MLIGLLIIFGIAAIVFIKVMATKAKRERLMKKYGDPEVVGHIMRRQIWQGQSVEQLVDSVGRPLDIDQKVLKSKVKETWKYNSTGKNRYGMRIIVEDDVVVGWDKKD